MPLVVGVDSSTTACKVHVRDADTGALVGTGRAPHPPTTPPRSEQDPQDWEMAFATACARAGVSARHHPAAVAFAAQQHGMVALDAKGEPLRPAKLWNDTESALDADQLLDELPNGAAGWAAACGSVPVPSFTITKLRWLRRCEPDAFRRIHTVVLPHDWLTSRVTRRLTTDRGDASGTGYWSPAEGRYRLDLLALVDTEVDWNAILPIVLEPREVAGEWPEHGAVVGPGTGDNMAAALALGMHPGDLVLSLGTSGTAYTTATEPRADPSGAVAGFADATGRFLPLVCTLNATKVTDSIAQLLGVSVEQFDALALSAPAGSDGLVLIPYFDGERTPNQPEATGILTGLRNGVSPAQLARASVEGVVCNLLDGADALGQSNQRGEQRVFLIGGGARSQAYRRVVADLTGRPVVVPREEELAACGAALQAAAVLHQCDFGELAAAWNLGEGDIVEPDDTVDRAAIRGTYAERCRASS